MSYLRAVSTLGCAELDLPAALALAARHGLAGVELRALSGSLALADHLRDHYGTPAVLRKMIARSGVRIAACDTSLRLTGSTAEERRAFLDCAAWADALDTPWLRVFDGDCGAGAAGASEARETIRWWRSERQRNGWRADCMVETHDSLLDTARLREFVAAVPGTAILWDSHHTWKLGGEDPAKTWRALRASIVHVHVKDSISQPSAHHPFTYVLPGHGEFPMRVLIDVLRAEHSGFVSLEWERLWHPYLPSLEEALRSAATVTWW